MLLPEHDPAPGAARDARTRALGAVADLLEMLNSPEGCPWDREQTPEDLLRYLTEECRELAEAVAACEPAHIAEEWGDVVFLVLFFALTAERSGLFTMPDAVKGLVAKMVSRHPHVFAAADVEGPEGVVRQWAELKAREREQADGSGILDGLPPQVSALRKAYALQARAAEVGFDWPEVAGVWDKVAEEMAELEQARAAADPAAIAHEIGDLHFALVNLQRHLGLEAEGPLNRAANRFEARFRTVERLAAERGLAMDSATLEQLDALWDEAKAAEAGTGP